MQTVRDKIAWRLTPGYYTAKLTEWALKSARARDAATRLAQRWVGDRPLPVGTSRVADVSRASADLRRDGYAKLGALLDQRTVSELLAHFSERSCFDPFEPGGTRFSPSNPPEQCKTAHFDRRELLECPLVVDVANDPGVLEIVRDYLGATPTLANLTMWWSYPGREGRELGQSFHRDRDDLRFCKLFIYLTDVDETSGPHVYVRGSADMWKLTEPRRFTDAEVEGAFGSESITTFCEPAGAAFLVDTFGVHKGLAPTKRNRLLLQVEYTLLPVGRERYDRGYKLDDIGTHDSYVNRLFVQK